MKKIVFAVAIGLMALCVDVSADASGNVQWAFVSMETPNEGIVDYGPSTHYDDITHEYIVSSVGRWVCTKKAVQRKGNNDVGSFLCIFQDKNTPGVMVGAMCDTTKPDSAFSSTTVLDKVGDKVIALHLIVSCISR